MADLNEWMSAIPDDRKLNQIILPASHDSGMAEKVTDLQSFRPASRANACTQELTIKEQFEAGIRWVDVRITPYNNVHRCFHSTAYGEKLTDVAMGLMEFLDANPTEVVIVLLTKSHDDSYGLFLDALKHCNQTRMAPINAGTHGNQITALQLGSLRGRVIVAMDKPPSLLTAPDPRILRAKLKKFDAKKAVKLTDIGTYSSDEADGKYEYMLNTAGSYSNSASVSTILSTQKDRAKYVKDVVGASLSVYYTTNTSPIGLRITSIKAADQGMWQQDNLEKWAPIAFQKVDGKFPLFNAIMMDFASEGRCFMVREQAEKLGF